MLPVAAINTAIPVQPPLVATALPDTSALRVPPDNVAPSVSTVSVDLNASGNSVPPPLISLPVQANDNATNDNIRIVPNFASAGTNPSAQAAFIAQLVSQEIPVSQRAAYSGVLEQYEKLVANSFVKYKPSNAGIPQFSPSHAFRQALEAPSPSKIEAPAPRAEPAAIQAEATPVQPTEPVKRAPAPLRTSRAPQQNLSGTTSLDISVTPPPAAISAYAATSTRNATAQPGNNDLA